MNLTALSADPFGTGRNLAQSIQNAYASLPDTVRSWRDTGAAERAEIAKAKEEANKDHPSIGKATAGAKG